MQDELTYVVVTESGRRISKQMVLSKAVAAAELLNALGCAGAEVVVAGRVRVLPSEHARALPVQLQAATTEWTREEADALLDDCRPQYVGKVGQ